MKTKKEIKRSDLKQNIMKYILFRIDYMGVIDAKVLFDAVNVDLSTHFSSFTTVIPGAYDYVVNDIESVSETLSIPVAELAKGDIYKFSNNKFGSDTLVLNIGRFFTTLQIECKNYTSIDEYLDFFIKLINKYKAHVSFFDVKRLSLRKVSDEVFKLESTEDDISNLITKVFDSAHFNIYMPSVGGTLANSRYYDSVALSENTYINIVREFQRGSIDGTNAVQVKLDLEGCMVGDNLESEINKKSLTRLNDSLFEVFKEYMSIDYLNNITHEK